ncbi:MAG: leucine-rich repeat domain-containing protein [Bacteroidaceae bacterium]|nr:leucine-rich repeat domain-containing protein [Bacteroidaceae bacterium]
MRNLFVALSMCMGLCAWGHDFEVNGVCYNVTSKTAKTVCVTYPFGMENSKTKYKGNVVIPDSVVYGKNKYAVTAVGDSAFFNCESLKSVTFCDDIRTIGKSAFESCKVLANVTLPEALTTISSHAFENCLNFTKIFIPANVRKIETLAFGYLSNVEKISVDENNIYYNSKNNCNAIIETSSRSLVCGCMNTVIPANIKTIKEHAFNLCTGLKEVTLPEGLRNIGTQAFWGASNLTKLTIPSTVTEIGIQAFTNGPKYIEVAEDNSVFDSRENCNAIIETATNTLVFGVKYSTIPSTITSIGDFAFYNCDLGRSLVLPEGIESIGERAFCYANVTHLTIPSTVNNIGYGALSTMAETHVYSFIEAPMELDGIWNISEEDTLHVSKNMTSVYKAVNGWNCFTILDDLDEIPAAISGVAASKKSDEAIYTIDGRRVDSDNLKSGVYIKAGKKFLVK